MENFGPFKGVQPISFPTDNGVTIIYGENMRGKTLLLNAFRYALFGKILSRDSQRSMSLHQTENWEGRDHGTYGFKVILEFVNDGSSYELFRSCLPKKGISEPNCDNDYIESLYLNRNGNTLSPGERDHILMQIIPEKVSRFFLFDGELLQQYEELLRNDSEMGKGITEAIERILGVPILINARVDISTRFHAAEKAYSKAAQLNQKSKEIGTLLDEQTELRDFHEAEIFRLSDDLKSQIEKGKDLEQTLRKDERIKSYLDEKDHLEYDIRELEDKISQKRKKLKEYMFDSWKSLLSNRLSIKSRELDKEKKSIEDIIKQNEINHALEKIARQSISENACFLCKQDLTENAALKLDGKLSDGVFRSTNSVDDDRLNRIIVISETLRSFIDFHHQSTIAEIKNNLDDLIVDRASKQDRVKEIREYTKDFDESKVRKSYSEYQKIVKEISIIEEGIKGQKAKLELVENSIKKLTTTLDEMGDIGIDKEKHTRDLLSKLAKLFDESINVYRHQLRLKVEKDATDYFLKLIHEDEYKSLEINENYGLTIVHEDGHNIPIRSAGAEHIVALSLMGALQKNAPLKGPIIMDSPFGRLDDEHTTRVIRTLPFLSDQVILLVYKSELHPQLARNELKDMLKEEYVMERISSRHSLINRSLGD